LADVKKIKYACTATKKSQRPLRGSLLLAPGELHGIIYLFAAGRPTLRKGGAKMQEILNAVTAATEIAKNMVLIATNITTIVVSLVNLAKLTKKL
jgi:hypothetical protein